MELNVTHSVNKTLKNDATKLCLPFEQRTEDTELRVNKAQKRGQAKMGNGKALPAVGKAPTHATKLQPQFAATNSTEN